MTTRALAFAALTLSALPSTGCAAAINALLGREAPSKTTTGLRDRGTKKLEQTAGANHWRCTLYYEADEHETWAFDDGFHCPPDFKKDKPHADDDPKLKEPVTPTTGAPTMAATVPDWCDDYDGWGRGQNWSKHYATPNIGPDSTPHELLAFAHFVAVSGCDRKHYRPRQAWVASWLQQWVNVTAMDVGATKVLLSELVQREDAVAQAQALACGDGPLVSALVCPEPADVPTSVELDAAEVAGTLDDAMRVAYLTRCRGAHCRIDAERVDWAGVPAMVANETSLATARFIARRTLPSLAEMFEKATDETAKAAAAYQAWNETVDASDPTLRAAFQIVSAGRRAEAHAEAVKRAKSMRRALPEGDAPTIPECPEGLAEAVDARITAGAPKTRAQAETLLEDPSTQILVRALALCERGPLAPLRGAAVARARTPWFGPRRAALQAVGARVDPLPPRSPAKIDGEAIVAGTKQQKDGTVLVRLRSRVEVEPRETCWETNRVDGIDSDGYLIYRERCKVVGKDRREIEPVPLIVPAAQAEALARGRLVQFHSSWVYGAYIERFNGKVTHNDGKTRKATIAAVYDSDEPGRDGKGLRWWLGLKLSS